MEAFQYLFNKFWSDTQRVTILGYEEPKFKLYKNFDFISLGEQTGIQDWCSDLRNFLDTIDDEYFIHAVEDQFIIRPVNQEMVMHLYDLMRGDVGRIALETAARTKPHKVLHTEGETQVIELDQEATQPREIIIQVVGN